MEVRENNMAETCEDGKSSEGSFIGFSLWGFNDDEHDGVQKKATDILREADNIIQNIMSEQSTTEQSREISVPRTQLSHRKSNVTPLKNYSCKLCTFKTTVFIDFITHTNAHAAPEEDPESFKCGLCSLTTLSAQRMIEHVQSHILSTPVINHGDSNNDSNSDPTQAKNDSSGPSGQGQDYHRPALKAAENIPSLMSPVEGIDKTQVDECLVPDSTMSGRIPSTGDDEVPATSLNNPSSNTCNPDTTSTVYVKNSSEAPILDVNKDVTKFEKSHECIDGVGANKENSQIQSLQSYDMSAAVPPLKISHKLKTLANQTTKEENLKEKPQNLNKVTGSRSRECNSIEEFADCLQLKPAYPRSSRLAIKRNKLFGKSVNIIWNRTPLSEQQKKKRRHCVKVKNKLRSFQYKHKGRFFVSHFTDKNSILVTSHDSEISVIESSEIASDMQIQNRERDDSTSSQQSSPQVTSQQSWKTVLLWRWHNRPAENCKVDEHIYGNNIGEISNNTSSSQCSTVSSQSSECEEDDLTCTQAHVNKEREFENQLSNKHPSGSTQSAVESIPKDTISTQEELRQLNTNVNNQGFSSLSLDAGGISNSSAVNNWSSAHVPSFVDEPRQDRKALNLDKKLAINYGTKDSFTIYHTSSVPFAVNNIFPIDVHARTNPTVVQNQIKPRQIVHNRYSPFYPRWRQQRELDALYRHSQTSQRASPWLASPWLAPPRLTPPRLTPPRLALPGLTPPRLALPGLAPTRLALPGLAPTRLALPGLAPPKLAFPGLAPPRLAPRQKRTWDMSLGTGKESSENGKSDTLSSRIRKTQCIERTHLL